MSEPIVPWYLDGEPNNQETKDEVRTKLYARQPWRFYWPPRSQITTNLWLRSEFPEVLAWRFDLARPFDRPWRTWSRTARTMVEKGAAATRQQHPESFGDENASKNRRLHREISASSGDVLRSPRTSIDGVIKNMNFSSVTSDAFCFMAPSDLYQTEKPYLSRLPCGTGLARTNIVTESRSISVFDANDGNEKFFTLEESGFKFAKSPIRMQEWTDLSVCSGYIPKLKDWLVQHLMCSEVFAYAYNFRGKSPAGVENKSIKAPFLRAHCDATPASCLKRLQLYFPGKAEIMMKSRVRFLNVWRAISSPVQDCPLALCDFRTVQPEQDLVAADIIFPHYQDEAYEVLYNPGHRWFYKKGMEWDDVLLFKLGDTALDEAPLCPHAAFMDPSVPKGTPGRVSIEVRFIVVG